MPKSRKTTKKPATAKPTPKPSAPAVVLTSGTVICRTDGAPARSALCGRCVARPRRLCYGREPLSEVVGRSGLHCGDDDTRLVAWRRPQLQVLPPAVVARSCPQNPDMQVDHSFIQFLVPLAEEHLIGDDDHDNLVACGDSLADRGDQAAVQQPRPVRADAEDVLCVRSRRYVYAISLRQDHVHLFLHHRGQDHEDDQQHQHNIHEWRDVDLGPDRCGHAPPGARQRLMAVNARLTPAI